MTLVYFVSVQVEESERGRRTCALVPIDERMPKNDCHGVGRCHAEEIHEELTIMGGLRGRNGSLQALLVAESSITASAFDFSSVDVGDGVYVEKERFGHLLPKFV